MRIDTAGGSSAAQWIYIGSADYQSSGHLIVSSNSTSPFVGPSSAVNGLVVLDNLSSNHQGIGLFAMTSGGSNFPGLFCWASTSHNSLGLNISANRGKPVYIGTNDPKYLRIFGGLTGSTGTSYDGAPSIEVEGADANISLYFRPTGAGGLGVHSTAVPVALGGGAAPTFGTIGGAGPTAAAQAGWFAISITTGGASTTYFFPMWK